MKKTKKRVCSVIGKQNMCYRVAAAKVIDPVALSAARILCIYPGGGAVCPKRRGKGTGELNRCKNG